MEGVEGALCLQLRYCGGQQEQRKKMPRMLLLLMLLMAVWMMVDCYAVWQRNVGGGRPIHRSTAHLWFLRHFIGGRWARTAAVI